MNKFHVQNITISSEDSNDCVWSKSHWLNENLAGGHHSPLTPISLQLTKPPTTSMTVVQYDYTRCEHFGLIFVKYFRKTFPPFQCDSHGLPMGIQNGGERRGEHPRQKLFYVGLKPQNTLAKTQRTFAKNGTHLQKNKHVCKKIGTHLQKKCNTFAVFLKSLKRRQSWNEGGWIVRDHLQDTFGSFP